MNMPSPIEAMQRESSTLVLGIGNVLLQDEGAGVRAVELLQRQQGDLPRVQFVDGGTRCFSLAASIETCSALLVLDVVELNAPPGTIQVFEGAAMDRFLSGGRKCGVGEISLLDLLTLAVIGGGLPRQRALIGIQPAVVDWGDTPSPSVAQALPDMAGCAMEMIARWRQ